MATLHVRNVPDPLYQHLQQLAAQENRSLTAEVLDLLGQAIEAREMSRGLAERLQHIRRSAEATQLPEDWVDAVELLRADRSR